MIPENTAPRGRPPWLLAVILPLLLSACLGVPLGSLYRLSQLDPLTADPAGIRVAIRHPAVIAVDRGAVALQMTYSAETGELELDERLPVQVRRPMAPTPALLDGLRRGEEGTVLELAAADAERMRAFQQAVRAHRAQGFEGTGSFGIGISNACRTGLLPDGPVEVDVLFTTDPAEDFIVFRNGIDLRAVGEEGRELVDALAPCAP